MFTDRRAAGKVLSQLLSAHQVTGGIVLALPRGGVPVGDEIATALGLPLDLMLVRKVGMPGHPEVTVTNPRVLSEIRLSPADVERLAIPERAELMRRRNAYLGTRAAPVLTGRPVILADDGVATGATMRAAIAALRRDAPSRIIVAVPVGAADTLAVLRREADEVICPEVPAPFYAVGQAYASFPQVSDDEVTAILSRHPPSLAAPSRNH